MATARSARASWQAPNAGTVTIATTPAVNRKPARRPGKTRSNSLLSSAGADGATTQTSTNPDGSTTTTISYSDGSSVEMTSPAAPAGGSNSDSAGNGATGQNSANLLEQLIRLQAQLLSAAAPALSAFV